MPSQSDYDRALDRPTHAKIVATIGPASESPEAIAKLIESGVSVFRFNFSHGDFAAHAQRLKVVRDVAAKLDSPVAVMGDLPGPKIRVGRVSGDGITVQTGQEVVFANGIDEAKVTDGVPTFPTTYELLVREVDVGQRVLVNDGAIRMLAIDSNGEQELRCVVTVGGLVTTGKGINLPDTEVSAPPLGQRDWNAVEWAVANGVDFLAMSFVRCAAEVLELKDKLAGMCSVDFNVDGTGSGAMIPVVAKIERPQALEVIDEIVDAADAIMVARGDLGVEMDIARVPVGQKRIIDACQRWGKPCIVATQMLETMIENASPTRAEASDVANAIFDGADAVMLSGETAVGKHPPLVVQTMRRIVSAAEERINGLPHEPSPPAEPQKAHHPIAALAHGSWHIAKDLDAKLIVCWSEGGGTALLLSQNGFRIPIIAYSSNVRTTRRMALLGGVTALHRKPPDSGLFDDWLPQVEQDLIQHGWAAPNDPILIIAGEPLSQTKSTNGVTLHRVGSHSS